MSFQATIDLVYLLSSLFVTVYVGHLLHRDGCPFLDDIFSRQKELSRAINDLLLTGYYLTNFALDVLLLHHPEPLRNGFDALHWYTRTLGIVLITLGLMHFFNVSLLILIKKTGLARRLQNPSGNQ